MITGATSVLGPVPACHVDPFLLAQGQPPETYGYISILYPGQWCDILFFRGQTIRYAGRLREHHRFLTREAIVRESFLAYRADASTAVSLFTAHASAVRAFLSSVSTRTASLWAAVRRRSRSKPRTEWLSRRMKTIHQVSWALMTTITRTATTTWRMVSGPWRRIGGSINV